MPLHLVSYMVVVCCLAFPFVKGGAQSLNPTATLVRENGMAPETPLVLESGGEYTGAAPLEFLFSSGIESPSATLRYEWNFAEDGEFGHIFLTRFDQETSYTFNRSGACFVRLIVTDTDTGDTQMSATFQIRVAESELKIPNAFSPNADGVHDVFEVQHKSLVQFSATVFNRWGQQLYRWGLADIDKGWDGTAHGSQVPDGVYFIVVEAQGADGVVYKIKGDINILR